MKTRTQQQWRELFKQQAAGDLSVAAFCKEHGIGQSYFYKRKSDLTVKNGERPASNFIKVKPQQKNIQALGTHQPPSPLIRVASAHE